LIPAASRDAAIGVLRSLGYGLARAYGDTHHAFGDFAREGDPAAVDLHTELVDPRYILTASEVRGRGTTHHLEGAALIVPSPTDRVLHNFLHAQIHHLGHYYRGEMPVAQVYELAALARSFGASVDWLFIERRLQCHRLTTAFDAYVLAASRLFDLPWPLSSPAGLSARLHHLRCWIQANLAAAQWLGVTWGNLTGPLAWHRMRALYGEDSSVLLWRCRHIARFVAKKGPAASVAKLRRAN